MNVRSKVSTRNLAFLGLNTGIEAKTGAQKKRTLPCSLPPQLGGAGLGVSLTKSYPSKKIAERLLVQKVSITHYNNNKNTTTHFTSSI